MLNVLILGIILLLVHNEAKAVVANPIPIQYKQPDGTIVTIKLKGDEFVSWGETLDGYTLLSDGNNGWAYAVLNADGDLVSSDILTHNQGERTAIETSLLPQIPKKLRYSQKQIDNFRSTSDVRLKGATATTAFTPMGPKKLLLILIDFTDQPFNNPLAAHADFDGLLNTVGYTGHNAHGSVKDFFYESSYGNFNLTTTVVGPYHAANNMSYYGATGSNGAHDKNAKALILEAVLAANADVDYTEYANENNEVEGVYVVYAGYGEATSMITDNIWPHAGSISTQTLDGVKVSKYSCSNELTAGGTELTTIGVICHEFGHVCGSPDFYDTDYETNGKFEGNGSWDVMDTGLYNGSPSGSQPAHFNPYIKTLFNWATPTELTTSGTRTVADITTTPEIYKVNTKTPGEYFLIENRQQTGFNTTIPGHGLMIYRMGAVNYLTNKNTGHPQGFYPICASSTTAIPYNAPASYGDISSAGCPFPGSSGKHAFYDTGIPSSKSWAGVNTELPITNIAENADHTVSFTIPAVTACTPSFTNQASAFTATSPLSSTMNIGWTRGGGEKVLVVAREGSAVDFDPLNGTNYTANAAFRSGDELGQGNFVVYNGTGTTASLTGLNGGTAYYFAVYEYNTAANCYLTPALTGNGTTNCTIDPTTFVESFERSSFGCWTATDNTGEGNWKIGTTSNTNLPPNLIGNYAYFKGEYAVAHSYNADLISPTFDLSSYSGVALDFKHHFDASNSYPSTGTVYYSINNGDTWNSLATYTSDQSNATVSLNLPVAVGQSQVKFKWNYTCAPTGAFMWAIDDIQVKDVPENPSSVTATATSSSQINLSWTKNSLSNDVIIAYSPTNIFGTPVNGTTYFEGTSLSGGGTVLYKGSLTTFNHTGLNASTTYYYKIWSVSATNKYSAGLTPVSETTDCNAISILPFEENFSAGTLPGCWKVKDNTGQGNWQFGTTSNVNYTPTLTGNYAYFKGVYGVAHNYNADLISPTFDFSTYGGVSLSFTHLFDASGSNPSTGTVYYSIDNGVNWNPLATYTSDSSNPQVVTLGICAVAGQSQVRFKWTYTCSPTGAYLWAVDDIKIVETSGIWNGLTNTDWHTGSNWCSNAVPTATTNVIIPTGVTNMPYISSTTVASCNDITLSTGTTLKMAANTELDVKGNWVNNGNLDYTNSISTSLVKFNGSTTQTYSGSTVLTLRKFEVSNASGITLEKELRADNITLTNGIVLTNGTAKLNLYGGTLSRTNGYVNGTLQKYVFTNPSSQKVVTFEIGDATNYTPASLTFATNCITLAGGLAMKTTTGDHTNIASSTLNTGKSVNRYWSFPYIGITFSSCNMVFNYIAGDLDATANTSNLVCGKYTASVWTYPTVGTKTSTSTQITGITSLGDFALAEGFGKTSTGGNWSVDATWSPSGVPVSTDNVLILSPGTVVVDVPNAVCQELTIQNRAKLQINPLQALTVSETITNNSDVTGLVIKSDDTGNGSLIATNVSGQASAESYLTGNRWYNVTPIVSGGGVSSFIQNSANAIASKEVNSITSYGMMSYNETGNAWNSYYTGTNTDNMNAAQGYSLRRSTNGVVTYSGVVYSGTKTVSLTNAGQGWNCIGNPYTSAISMNDAANTTDDNFLKANAIDASNLDPAYACIYVWDEAFKGYRILGNSPATSDDRVLDQSVFQSGQGFFVKAKTAGSQVVFNSQMQLHSGTMLLKSSTLSWPGFELIAQAGSLKASTTIAFNNKMTNGLDPTYDAGLLRGTSGLELYSRLVDDNGIDFTVQCLPDNDLVNLVIPIGITSKVGGTVIFSSDITNLPPACNVILEDKLNRRFTDLSKNTYQTTIEANTTNSDRFQIHTSYLTTGLKDGILTDNLIAFAIRNVEIRVKGKVTDNAVATLYDNMGRMILVKKLDEGDLNIIPTSNLRTGIYLLSVKDTGVVQGFKLLLKE